MGSRVAASGKLAPEILEKAVLAYGGAERDEVLIGPAVGEDAAVIRWPADRYLVVASDPIVGADRGAGRLLVVVNSNDIASKGGDPAFLISTLIFPTGSTPGQITSLVEEIHEACLEAGIAVIGGHTEINDRYDHPVICATMMGMAEKVLTARDIKPGDAVVMTKHVAIEGMCILANDRRELLRRCLSDQEIDGILQWSDLMSVLPESRILRKWALFMHDPTEGGFLGGLGEIARLSGLGVSLDREAVNIDRLTLSCSECLGFDPLRLISSGVLVAVIPRKFLDKALEALEASGIACSVIGEMVQGEGDVPIETREELWALLADGRPLD